MLPHWPVEQNRGGSSLFEHRICVEIDLFACLGAQANLKAYLSSLKSGKLVVIFKLKNFLLLFELYFVIYNWYWHFFLLFDIFRFGFGLIFHFFGENTFAQKFSLSWGSDVR